MRKRQRKKNNKKMVAQITRNIFLLLKDSAENFRQQMKKYIERKIAERAEFTGNDNR